MALLNGLSGTPSARDTSICTWTLLGGVQEPAGRWIQIVRRRFPAGNLINLFRDGIVGCIYMVLSRDCSVACRLAPFLLVLYYASAGLSQHIVGQAELFIGQRANPGSSRPVQEGEALAAEGRFAEAEVPLREAIEVSPQNDHLLIVLGRVEARLGKRKEAVDIFRRVVKNEPRKADAYVDLAIALADAGELAEALQEATTAVTLSPNLPLAHLNRARILADLQRSDEAETEFSITTKLAPNNPDCFFYWALLEKDRGNSAKQVSLLKSLVRLEPNNEKALLLLAASLKHESKHTEAIAVLRRVLQIDPTSESALYMLSMELRETDPTEARKLQEDYMDEHSRAADLTAIKSLGNAANEAAKRQDWAEAIALLRKALGACGNCEVVAALHKNLGLALCQSGNTVEGRKELKAALKLDPADPDIVKALSIVSE